MAARSRVRGSWGSIEEGYGALNGSTFGRARVALLMVIVGMLAMASSAGAANTTTPFATGPTELGPTCAPQSDGTRLCTGIVNSFDGAPIDVKLVLPPATAAPVPGVDGSYPLVMGFHGWGGQKNEYNLSRWVNRGYAGFSMSDRGWGNSCGGQDQKRPTPQCTGTPPGQDADGPGSVSARGYNHLMDTRFEVRDAQVMASRLVDNGVVDPTAIGATGPSYGGGISMALAALNNRTMKLDGTLMPWVTPNGTPMRLAAAAPDIPWTDLAYSLVPNGYTLDYAANNSYDKGPIGVMKQSFVSGLYAVGVASSNFTPPGTDPSADVHRWYSRLSAGEPYEGDPTAQEIVDEVTSHHSSYYIDNSTRPSPLLIANGWTDDLFPVDEAVRYYNKTKQSYPGADISMMFLDFGHARGQNKAADVDKLRQRQEAWFDFYLKGQGTKPANEVTALTQTCPKSAPSAGPFSAPTWAALAPGEVRFQTTDQQVIAPEAGNAQAGQAFDPIAGGGACATASALDQPGVANYRLPAATGEGYTLMGSPTIVADVRSTGPNSQLAARLLDVDPGGNETLVARGIYRPELTPTAPKRQVFQLHPNGYKIAAGHVAKLELLPSDSPYARKSDGQAPITISNLDLRLPVREVPGSSAAVTEPSPKVLPPGYALARDFAPIPVDTDGDGVADGQDMCPSVAAPESANGCPASNDTDNDGVTNGMDACPDQAGPPANQGCPTTDSDGDGVADSEDACKTKPGPAANAGCPIPADNDADDDGFANGADECPNEYGTKANGCPAAPPSGRCKIFLSGTAGRDRLVGTSGSDRIRGRDGRDLIRAGRGDDCVAGQSGNDRLFGQAGGDRIRGGPGHDRISGGGGGDRIGARDGQRDAIRCGGGADVAVVDRRDRTRGCEKVRRGR